MSPDTMLEKQPSFLRIVISCFLVFTDKLHVITSARLFCGLWLLWNTVQTCILNFWPSWSTCGRRLEKLTKKSKSKKLQNVVQKDSVSMTVYFLWLSIKSIIIWHQIVFWTVYWELSRAASMNVRVSCEHLGSRAVVISWESLPPKYSRNTPKKWACSRVT